ncbi:MAG TPA: DNA polymerase/3'-5' exonuclease PolX [Candidatus Krumholzibacteria bacterium]|nr:DNA polymerase/3'-5' exonuclease PolX [Candidatus Krumholzibacteria bacterium]
MAAAADKKTVIKTLERIAVLLELSGANPFKSRAFQNGARALQSYEGDLTAGLESGELKKIKGVGKGILTEVESLLADGTSPALVELEDAVPAGLLEIVRVPGLGPKRVRVLHEKLGIETLGELEYACNENRLVQLDGFGAKTQQKILAGIETVRRFGGRHLLSDAWAAADRLMDFVRGIDGVEHFELAGSIRRRRETIKDVDILVSAADPGRVHEAFTGMDAVAEVIGSGDTKTSVRLDTGIQVDLRTVTPRQFPFALHYFTGSKEHNTRMRQRAKDRGLKLNEYGLFPTGSDASLELDSEDAIFEALDLHPIPPELREDMGEFDAAEQGDLPPLVEEADIRGVLHNHTTWSDGAHSVREMAEAARAMGYQYLGLSDHSQSAFYAHGLKPDAILRQHEEIDEVNASFDDFVVLKGIESDILPDGSLDYDDDVLERMDFVVASVHGHFGLKPEDQTKRCIRAVQNPFTSILGHPTGRLLLARDGFEMDLEAVIEAAVEVDCALELNANPHRLDLDWRELRHAAKLGARISIGPDAHRTEGLQDVRYGVAVARKGWLRAENVLNALPLDELRAWLRARRG